MPLRNYVHRRQHKERSQLSHRKKFGLLEKHKDYVQRAKDHHSKRDRIKKLKEKALDRNQDEFYFGMIKNRVEKGIHIQARTGTPLSHSLTSLLKTQDASYLRRALTSERKRIEALIAEIAPNVADMRIEWLEEKESRTAALKEAGLLGANKKGKKSIALRDDVGDGKIGTQGKRTVWVEGGADEVRAYKPNSLAGPSSLSSMTTTTTTKRQIEDYDLDDIDEDLLVEEGELSDSDSEADDDDDDEDLEDAVSLSDEEQDEEEEEESPATQRRRRLHEKHLSTLLSLLRARQIRYNSLQTASRQVDLVRSLMSNKGGGSVSKKKVDAKKDKLTEAVLAGKMTKNGLALPGNEEEDDEEEEVNGRKKKEKVTYKWSKERSR